MKRNIGISLILIVLMLLSCEKSNKNDSPIVSELIYPDDIKVPFGKVNFRWSRSHDNDNDTVYYDLYLGEKDNLKLVKDNLLITSYSLHDLLPHYTYYWKVISHDTHGNRVESNQLMFYTENTIPSQFDFIYPQNGMNKVKTDTLFKWFSAKDTDGDKLVYKMNLMSNYNDVEYNISDTSLAISDLLYGQIYSIYMKVSDGIDIRSINSILFKTENEVGSFIDPRDNNKYKWVKIAGHTIMAENLRYGVVGQPKENDTVEMVIHPDNNISEKLGGFYSYAEIISYKDIEYGENDEIQGICPKGWHIPTRKELNEINLSDNYLYYVSEEYGGDDIYYFNGYPFRFKSGVFEETKSLSTYSLNGLMYYFGGFVNINYGYDERSALGPLRCVKD